ncbi:N-6 DNA methylase [Micromonospora globbae]|uniref:N-6 DNA methylase n=1 Tax=Micromonospora globbae TaxID=1894969 RepID=A0ABZ1SEC2_9ACTN|nr:N-6 DNA methylase [Micromonospora globbae]
MTAEPSITAGKATLTASGIAELANVGRAAVSNWRRRHADFPAPVGGTPTSPFFDAHEVEQWLRRHGKLHQPAIDQWAWRHIESYQPSAQITEALGIAGAYLLVRSQHSRKADPLLTPKQLVARLRALDSGLAELVGDMLPKQWTPQLTTLLRTIDQLSEEQEPETAFEFLHSRYANSAHPLSGLASTPDSVADVMLTLAGSGTRTFDFTCGTGSLLRAAVDRALQDGEVTHVYAQEINPQYALIALLRLWFVHLRAQRDGHQTMPPAIHIGDSMLADAFPDLQADVVVANFPFGIHDWGHDRLAYDPRWTYGLPPRTEPELAWVQHALAHLSPDGTAVVLMPPAAAQRPAGRRIRAELVRRGALRAVIALPAGLMPPTGIGLHVWVLTHPHRQQPQSGGLLVVDTTAASTDRPLSDIVGTAWRAYLTGRNTESPGVHRTIPIIDLLDDQVDLTPHRHLPQAHDLATDPNHLIDKISDFGRLIGDVRQGLPAVQQASSTVLRTAPRASMADLIRAGSVSVLRAPSRGQDTTHGADDYVLTSADILAARPATGTTNRAASNHSGPRVSSGDILIPVMGREIVARVATPEQVGAQLGPGVQSVRVDTALFDPWFVAGVISHRDSTRAANRTSNADHGTLRIDVRRLAIPVLPLDLQQAYGQVFRQLAEFRARLDQAAEAGATLAREISDALTAGTLEIVN